MNNENLLCDLESDIDGDWEKIQESIKIKEEEKQIEKEIEHLKDNPLRMNFPNFADFYSTLFVIFRSLNEKNVDTIPYEVRRLIDRMFYQYGDIYSERMSPAFDYVWGMFCDPSRYSFYTAICNHCNSKWDMVFQRKHVSYASYLEGMRESNITEELYRVICPKCANAIATINNEILGIFKHKKLSKEDILDKEKYREILKEGGYGIR